MTSALAINAVVAHRYEIRQQLVELPAFIEYRAFDLEVEVDVAVWWVRRELFPSEEAANELVAAVKRMRDLRHANLRRVFDAGWEGEGLYVTAQLASYDRVVPRVPAGSVLDNTDLLHFATSVIDGISAAHLNGRVHGRLSPHDIVHVARLIKVSGTGIYSGVERYAAGQQWEPYAYFLAPEVLAGEPPTVKSDVFSVARIIADVAGGLTVVAEKLPDLAEVFADACAADPDARVGSAEDLLDLLRGVLVDGRVPTNERAAITPPPELAPEMSIPPPLDTGEYTLVEPVEPVGEELTATIRNGEPVRRKKKKTKPRLSSSARADDPIDFSSLELDSENDLPRNRMVTRPIRKVAPEFGDGQETVLEDGLVSGAPPPPAPSGTIDTGESAAVTAGDQPGVPAKKTRAQTGGALPFRSMKPPSEKGAKPTPPMSVMDRPGMKPRLRAISSSVEAVPSQLGNYAPPRPSANMVASTEAGTRKPWVYIAAVVGALAIGLGAVLLIAKLSQSNSSGDRQSDASATPKVTPRVTALDAGRGQDGAAGKPTITVNPAVRAIDAGNVVLRCGDGMSLVRGASPFCIDSYESPGKGRFPAAGVTLDGARASCARRKARLCTEPEWVASCRGRSGASFPYGSSFMPGLCNTKGKIRAAGSYSRCRSAVGAYDMSGNVAEWVQGGIVKGGSAKDPSKGRCSAKQIPPGRGKQGFGDVGFRCCAAPAQ